MMARRVLAAILVALLAVPAGASPPKVSPVAAIPIGTFSYSDSAIIGGAGALAGTTVFSGDVIEVGPRGSAWILLNGGMQVRVSSSTRLRLAQLDGSTKLVEMEMFSGAARFRTSEASPVVARLADATVRAKGAKPTVGIISILSPRKAMVGAELGELLLITAHDGRSITVREGEAVELALSDPPPGKPQGKSGAAGASTSRKGLIATVIVGGIMAAGIGIALAVNNKGLTDQEKQNLVSPFKFP